TLDTARNEVRGTVRILYENHAPDALDVLWLQVEQNLFAPGSINEITAPPPLIFGATAFDMANRGFLGGLTIDRLLVAGREVPRYLWDTMLRLDLPAPLRTGESVTLDVAYHFPIPVNGAGRMGRDGPLYEIAQWYPRLAVYDDVHGWNTMPYIGTGEFYLEYGDYDVRLTVPAGFVVACTGTLENPAEVLTAAQRERLARARGSAPVAIITAEEAGNAGRTRPSTTGMLTWHFRADNVRDVAWAAAPNFRWDAVSWNGILIQTLYRPSATLWATEGIRMAEHSIRFFSQAWAMYPYPQATTVEGPINGMEYPMLTFVPAETTREGLYWVLMHEFGHEWFPMLVGSDERRFPWMDEGFNTFIDLYAFADYFRGTPPADTIMTTMLSAYQANAVPGQEQPLASAPSEVRSLYFTAYQKPALMLKLLREEVLGPEAFDRAFREYVRRWSFRHPQPADFFRTMDNLTGRNLDWFWRAWVYTTARLDQAIDSVGPAPQPAGAAGTGAQGRRGTGSTQGVSGRVRIVLLNRGQ
ncbi:MAG: M1 family metallopeptidase, partial [Gemmatimonadota bacterium]